jgi:hypothetical protein
MHICFKIIKFLLHSTLLYMFRTPLCPSSGAFHHCNMQPLVTVWCCVGCVLQPCSVVTAVGRGFMYSGGRLLMMDTVVSETCRAT